VDAAERRHAVRPHDRRPAAAQAGAGRRGVPPVLGADRGEVDGRRQRGAAGGGRGHGGRRRRWLLARGVVAEGESVVLRGPRDPRRGRTAARTAAEDKVSRARFSGSRP